MWSVKFVLICVWIMAILPIAIISLPLRILAPFREVVSGFSRRGKTMQRSASHRFKFTVPQKYFCHFYVLGVAWTTLLLVSTWRCAYRITPVVSERTAYSGITSQLTGVSNQFSSQRIQEERSGIWNSVFLLFLMEIQVLGRLFESLYVFKYSPSARMHIMGYLAGLFFYTAAPLSLCCEYASEVFKFVGNVCAEVIIKGKDTMLIEEFDLWEHVAPVLHLRLFGWLGAALFSWGWIHQRRCHAILGSLRKNASQMEHYVIPYGDWFDYVSSPHYLAEIVIYSSFVIAGGFSEVAIWLLLAFVVANLFLAAGESHKWYSRKFDDYPTRFAILPFVY